MCFFFLMIRRPPRSTRTDTLFPYTTLFRSTHCADERSDRCVTVISTLKPVSAHCEPENGPVVYDGIFLHGRNQDARFAAQIAAKLMLDTVRWLTPQAALRSEERRVGKECVSTCRSRWSPYH